MNAPKEVTQDQMRELTRDARCSYCGKSQSEVRKLVMAAAHAPDAPSIGICDECFVPVAEVMTGKTPVISA